jgi:hypothetical protein
MQTLVDPFELGSQATPRPQPVRPSASEVNGDGEQHAEHGPIGPRSEVWERVRCWCSEE